MTETVWPESVKSVLSWGILIALGSLLITVQQLTAAEISGEAGGEIRAFAESPLGPEQHNANLSGYLQPKFYHSWNNRKQSIIVEVFGRLDQNDPERRHFDVRELYWELVGRAYELRVGIRKVFWGVVETQHLVDVINQTDFVENIDGEDKLGQPMVNLALIGNWGTFDFFVLPGFRERTFPGQIGRLRPPLYVDTDLVTYESADQDRRVDIAARWSRTFGNFDVGLAHFYGTGREPTLLSGTGGSGNPVLVPKYEIIDQTSVDVQATLGGWLLKLESLTRGGQGDRFYALSGGIEYTLVGIFGTILDLGLLSEYHFDDRHAQSPNFLEDDFFGGFRFAFNDANSSEILSGIITDRESGPSSALIEASRRIWRNWKVSIEGRAILADSNEDPVFSLRRDDFIQIDLIYYY